MCCSFSVDGRNEYWVLAHGPGNPSVRVWDKTVLVGSFMERLMIMITRVKLRCVLLSASANRNRSYGPIPSHDFYPHTTTHGRTTTPATTPEMTQNATLILSDPHKSYLATARPWYYNPEVQLSRVMSDFWLSLLAPVIAYWLFCAFFEILDGADWRWLRKYKIHQSSEVASRNRVTKGQVLVAVILQHIIQVALGYFWMDTNAETGIPIQMHVPRMEAIAPTILRSLEAAVGPQFAAHLWLHKAHDLVYYTYWWAIPLVQLLAGL